MHVQNTVNLHTLITYCFTYVVLNNITVFLDILGNTAITEFFVLKTSLRHNTQIRFVFVMI